MMFASSSRAPCRSLKGYRASDARPDKTFRGISDAAIPWTARGAPGKTEAVYPQQEERTVSAETPFRKLIRRVRAGDQDAATELVRQYEPAIRRVVRVRLTDTRLRAALDSMDVCQSVLATFFVRAALGQYEL